MYISTIPGNQKAGCCSDVISGFINIHSSSAHPIITQLALGAYYREVKGRYKQVDPDDMTVEEIKYVIQQFTDAAIRADASHLKAPQSGI